MANRRVWDAEEIAVFCEQISLILSSNISLYEGVEALQGGYAGTSGEDAMRAMDDEMKGSGSFAAAVSACGAFPAYMTGMVRVGEEAGELDAVMQGLAEYYHQEAQLRAGAASAVRYPLTLMGVMALVIAVLVFQVIPIFEQAFRSLSGGMRGASASMLRVGQMAGLTVFAVMLVLMVAALALYLLLKDGKHPALRARLMRLAPPLKKLERMMAAQKLASVLAMLMGGGFPLEQALNLTPDVFADGEQKQMMQDAAQKALSGEPISQIIEETGLFDPLHLRMIRVGFESGQADAALGRVSQLLAQSVDDAMGRLIALIEPVLVVILSAMIGAILLSVMMPLAGVLSAMV